MVPGAVMSASTKNTARSSFPKWLAFWVVLFAFLINAIAMTKMNNFFFDTISSDYYFSKVYELKRALLFAAYAAYSAVYVISASIIGESATISSGISANSRIFPLGIVSYADMIIVLSDIIIGGLQWYWIGRLLVWLKNRLRKAVPGQTPGQTDG
jgi:hypothetical protein